MSETSVMAPCSSCGKDVSIRTAAQGSGLCRSCGMRALWARRHRIAAGTASPLDIAAQAHSRSRTAKRAIHVGKCCVCGVEILNTSPVNPNRKCRACFMKSRWGDDVRIGGNQVAMTLRIDKYLMTRLRETAEEFDMRIVSIIEGAIHEMLVRTSNGTPPSRYERS